MDIGGEDQTIDEIEWLTFMLVNMKKVRTTRLPLPSAERSARPASLKVELSTIEEIREQFKRMDKDGSGALDINDLLIMAAESRAIRARTSSDSARNSRENSPQTPPRRRNRSPAKPI
jgi:YbbR domain-containing protein